MADVKSPQGPGVAPPVDSPPPYSTGHGSAGSPRSSGLRGPTRVPGLPELPYDQYTPASASISSDGSTMTIADSVLAGNPTALVSFLRAQAALPAFLIMRVKGVSYAHSPADFDVSLNLMRYIYKEPGTGAREGDEGGSGSNLPSNYVRLNVQGLPGDSQGKFRKKELTLQTLAQTFCSDRLTTKSLTITRRVDNLDESILTARVMQMLGELKYKGEVEVTFPIRMGNVRVTPSNTAVDKFVGFFSKPRDYSAVEIVWPFAKAPAPAPEQHDTVAATERGFVVRSEEGLWYDWRPAFERAVLGGRQGWVTLEDLMEAKMGLPGPKRKTMEWGHSANYQ